MNIDSVFSKLVKTDTVIMEYVKLPVTSLQYRFLYRFIEPIPTVWVEGAVPVFRRTAKLNKNGTVTQEDNSLLEKNNNNLLAESLSEFATNTWRAMCLADMPDDKYPEDAKWLINIKKSKTYECEIKRIEE